MWSAQLRAVRVVDPREQGKGALIVTGGRWSWASSVNARLTSHGADGLHTGMRVTCAYMWGMHVCAYVHFISTIPLLKMELAYQPTGSTQISGSNTVVQQKEPRLLGEAADSRTGTKIIPNHPAATCGINVKTVTSTSMLGTTR